MDDRELKKIEAEIAARVLTRYHAESLARLVGKATAACRDVLVAYQGLEQAGLNEAADDTAWLAAFDQFDAALRRVANIISEFDRQTGLALVIEALQKEFREGHRDG